MCPPDIPDPLPIPITRPPAASATLDLPGTDQQELTRRKRRRSRKVITPKVQPSPSAISNAFGGLLSNISSALNTASAAQAPKTANAKP